MDLYVRLFPRIHSWMVSKSVEDTEFLPEHVLINPYRPNVENRVSS